MYINTHYNSDSKHMKDEPLCAQTVIDAYKFFLCRPPENSNSITLHMQDCKTFSELREKFIRSKEFQSYLQSSRLKSTGHSNIELDLDDARMTKLLAFVESTWTELGSDEPFWSVLTSDDFKAANFTEDIKRKFYESGKETLDAIKNIISISDENFDLAEASALEFGCGVGRNMVHLAPVCKQVIGVDISQPHLNLASQALRERKIHNFALLKISACAQLQQICQQDLVYSFITLQHNPPPVMAYLLNALFKLVKAKGFIIFQIPVAAGYCYSIAKDFNNLEGRKGMEMHALTQAQIFRIARENNAHICECYEDGLTPTANMISRTFAFKK